MAAKSEDMRIVCVLAVPSYMTPSDFLQFVGEFRHAVTHYRIIRDSQPNRFMVLMRFKDFESTRQFMTAYEGRPFTMLSSEVCHVVHVRDVEEVPTQNAVTVQPADNANSRQRKISDAVESLPADLSGLASAR